MSRPTNKKELLEQAEITFNKLLEFIDELPNEVKNRTYKNNELNERDKSVSDVICHLHEWHLMVQSWYKIGMTGKIPAMPAEDVKWKNLSVLNQRIWEKYKGTDLKKALTMLKKSHKDIMALIEKHNNDEIFTKKKYKWTLTSNMASYFIPNTSSHYNWALKTLKPLKKMVK